MIDMPELPEFLVRQRGEVRAVAPVQQHTEAVPERRRLDLPRHVEAAGWDILERVQGREAMKAAAESQRLFALRATKQAEAAAERERKAAAEAVHQQAVKAFRSAR